MLSRSQVEGRVRVRDWLTMMGPLRLGCFRAVRLTQV